MPNGPYYEAGAYIGQVTAQALGKAATGTPQLVLRFRVLGKPDPKDPDDNYFPVQEYERTIYRAITDKTVEYVMEDLNQLGYDRTGFGPLDPSHPNHQSFVGQQIDVYCKHERNQKGDQQEKWQLSRGPQALKVDPLDAKGVRELDAMFGKALKTKATPAAAKPAAAAATLPAQARGDANEWGITDDDDRSDLERLT